MSSFLSSLETETINPTVGKLKDFGVLRKPTGDDEGDSGGQTHPGPGGVLQAAQDQGEQWRHGSEDAQQHADDHQGSHRPKGTFDTKERLQNFESVCSTGVYLHMQS